MIRNCFIPAVLAVSLLAGPAVAQETPTPAPAAGDNTQSPQAPMAGFVWLRRPSAADFAEMYLRRAMNQDVSGRVELDCVVVDGGRLNCTVATETPPNYGFGAAALRISTKFRASTELSDGRSTVGAHLRLPINWQLFTAH